MLQWRDCFVQVGLQQLGWDSFLLLGEDPTLQPLGLQGGGEEGEPQGVVGVRKGRGRPTEEDEGERGWDCRSEMRETEEV
jgi:hypothetical protein